MNARCGWRFTGVALGLLSAPALAQETVPLPAPVEPSGPLVPPPLQPLPLPLDGGAKPVAPGAASPRATNVDITTEAKPPGTPVALPAREPETGTARPPVVKEIDVTTEGRDAIVPASPVAPATPAVAEPGTQAPSAVSTTVPTPDERAAPPQERPSSPTEAAPAEPQPRTVAAAPAPAPVPPAKAPVGEVDKPAPAPAPTDTVSARKLSAPKSTESPAVTSSLTPTLQAGGGVAGFIGDRARGLAGDGPYWDVRAVFGGRQVLGFEAAYIGALQRVGSGDTFLARHGVEGNVRLSLPFQSAPGIFLTPFGLAGIGWSNYSLISGGTERTGGRASDNVINVPVGGGLAISAQRFVVDLRFTYRFTTGDSLLGGGDGQLRSYGVGAQVGYEF